MVSFNRSGQRPARRLLDIVPEDDAFTTERYARFLIEEMIPFVESAHGLKISHDANDRGICVFVAAWNRPDAFGRVYSMMGTFVGLRGGDELATLVRKTASPSSSLNRPYFPAIHPVRMVP